MKNWYEVKEQAAGSARLMLTWYIYRIAGRGVVEFIAFFVTFFAFCFASDVRKYSAKYLKIVGIKPSLFNQFKHFLSYSYSLIDKMEACSGRLDPDRICFDNNEFIEDLKEHRGMFLICSHLGNTDVLRALFNKDESLWNVNVNIFLSESQCKIFNDFIKKVSKKSNTMFYPVEKIGIETSIELQEKLQNGELVFIAGDRVPINGSSVFKEKFLGYDVDFPKGVFKFAKLMDVPVYFVSVVKSGDKFIFYSKKNNSDEQEMRKNYVAFFEHLTLKYPYQFYHYYDFFA